MLYGGLVRQARAILDAAIGDSLMGKGKIKSFALLDEMSSNSCQWSIERLNPKRATGMIDVNTYKFASINLKHCYLGNHLMLDLW